ncbi:MAG: hypothetical protein U0Z44_10055 [Kouleothrix sp.]
MRYVRASAIVLLLSSLALLARAPMAAGRQSHALHLGDPVAQPPPGTYLFVELWVEVRGTGTLPPLIVEAPGYQFNPPTGVLLPTLQPIPPLYPSSWGFAGHGTSRKGAAGSGTRSNLSVINHAIFHNTRDWRRHRRPRVRAHPHCHRRAAGRR